MAFSLLLGAFADGGGGWMNALTDGVVCLLGRQWRLRERGPSKGHKKPNIAVLQDENPPFFIRSIVPAYSRLSRHLFFARRGLRQTGILIRD